MKRHVKGPAILLGGFLILLVGFVTVEHVGGDRALDTYESSLREKGEELSPADLAPTYSAEGSNAAARFLAAAGLLTNRLPVAEGFAEMMRGVAPGRARVIWQEAELKGFVVNNSWEELAREVAAGEGSMAGIEAAMRSPAFDFGLRYDAHSYRQPLPHLARAQYVGAWLVSAGLSDLRAGNKESVLRRLSDLAALAGVLEKEPVVQSQLARVTMARRGLNLTWEALQRDDWTDAQLAQMQGLWQNLKLLDHLVPALEMERATSLETLRALRRGDLAIREDWFASGSPDANDNDFIPGEVSKWLTLRLAVPTWVAAWGAQGELHYLQMSQHILEAGQHAVELKSDMEWVRAQENYHQWRNSPATYDVVRFLPTLYLLEPSDGAGPKFFREEARKSMAIAAIAIKRHQLAHGGPPASLEAMVPEFLSAVPTDYMDGKPLRYHPKPEGGFVLYSVGMNGVDDGGDPTPMEGEMHSIWSGKDAVWPEPVSATEPTKM